MPDDFRSTPRSNLDPDLETIDSCEVCAGRRFAPFRECREPGGPEIIPEMRGNRAFQIVRCAGCGLVFVNPRYNRDKLKRLYGSAYFRGEPNRPSAVARARYWSPGNDMRRLSADVCFLRRFASPGTILDAGCGLGRFADALGSAWRVTGVEWDAAAAARASRESQCASVMAADLEEVDLEPESFDGLIMIQVLDHLRRPLKVLRRLAPAIKPGGFVYISRIINIESPVSKIFKNDFRLLAPNHLYYFSSVTLGRLLDLAGFMPVAVHYPFFSTPYFSAAWPVKASSVLLHRLFGMQASSPPAPGNFITVLARKK